MTFIFRNGQQPELVIFGGIFQTQRQVMAGNPASLPGLVGYRYILPLRDSRKQRAEMLLVFRRGIAVPVCILVIAVKVLRFPERFCIPDIIFQNRKLAVREKQPEAFVFKKRFQPGALQPGQRKRPMVICDSAVMQAVVGREKLPFSAYQLWEDIQAAFCKAKPCTFFQHCFF